MRNLIDILDLSVEEIDSLIEKALDIEELVNRCEIKHQRLRLFPKK